MNACMSVQIPDSMVTIAEVMKAQQSRDMVRDELMRLLEGAAEITEQIRAFIIAEREATREFQETYTLYRTKGE